MYMYYGSYTPHMHTQVILVYLDGLTLSLTSGATYGNKKYDTN